MQTQKIKTPKYGQTPYYAEDGWLKFEQVETVTIKNAVCEYDKTENRWEYFDQNGHKIGSLWRDNNHLTIILTDEWDGGE